MKKHASVLFLVLLFMPSVVLAELNNTTVPISDGVTDILPRSSLKPFLETTFLDIALKWWAIGIIGLVAFVYVITRIPQILILILPIAVMFLLAWAIYTYF